MTLLRQGRLLLALALAAAIGAALVLASGSAAAAPSPSLDLERIVEETLERNPSFPGVALLVTAPGLRWKGAAGVADRATGLPLDPAAPFRTASITKTFTAASILRLVETGRLALDEPVAARLGAGSLAALEQGGYDARTITIRMLLQHTSGLYDFASQPAYQRQVVSSPRHRWTPAEQLRFAMTHGSATSAPGAGFHYTDTGFLLLGEILVRETGKPLATSFRSLLSLDRLGLDHTYLETLEPARGTALPRMHQYLGDADSWGLDPSFDLYGAGGLVSTLDDLARFYAALLTGHVFTRPETLGLMRGAAHPKSLADLGFGLFAVQLGAETCWGHQGFWGANVTYCPQSKVTIASTVNQADGFEESSVVLHTAVLRAARTALA